MPSKLMQQWVGRGYLNPIGYETGVLFFTSVGDQGRYMDTLNGDRLVAIPIRTNKFRN